MTRQGSPGLGVVGVAGKGRAPHGMITRDRAAAHGIVPRDRTAAGRGVPPDGNAAQCIDSGAHSADPHAAHTQPADGHQADRKAADAERPERPPPNRDEPPCRRADRQQDAATSSPIAIQPRATRRPARRSKDLRGLLRLAAGGRSY